MIISIKVFANRFPNSTRILTLMLVYKIFPFFIMITIQVFANHSHNLLSIIINEIILMR